MVGMSLKLGSGVVPEPCTPDQTAGSPGIQSEGD
jgi:hypothetical protein